MTHEVAETSKDAFKELKESGQDVTDRERCRRIIKEYGPITMEEMEPSMGKTKSAFSGRIRELKDNGKVKVIGREDGHQLLDVVSENNTKTGNYVQDSDTDETNLKPECAECGRQYEVLGVAMSCCEDVEQETQKQELEPGDTIWG